MNASGAQSVEHIVHIDGAQAPVALVLIDQAKRDRWFESNCHHTKIRITLAVVLIFVSVAF